MKFLKILILFSICFTTEQMFAQGELPDIVKEYKMINENAKKIMSAKIKSCCVIDTFSGRQDTISLIFYDKLGNITRQYDYTYDTTGTDRKRIYTSHAYDYDENGNIIHDIYWALNDSVKSLLYYGDNGDISRVEKYDSKNRMLKEVSYDYDDLSRLEESTEINYASNCKTSKQYSYDSYNNMVKLVVKNDCTDAGGKLPTFTFGYKYDKNYNILEKNSAYPTGEHKTETFKYDSKGKVTDDYESAGPTEYVERVITYDASGNMIKIQRSEGEADGVSQYTELMAYDKFGNLLGKQTLGPTGQQISAYKYVYEN